MKLFLIFLNYFLFIICLNYCEEGSYLTLFPPFKLNCSGYRLCDEGYYCNGKERISCPSGTYGNIKGLKTNKCSGLCFKGYYCPLQSINSYNFKCNNSNVYW